MALFESCGMFQTPRHALSQRDFLTTDLIEFQRFQRTAVTTAVFHSFLCHRHLYHAHFLHWLHALIELSVSLTFALHVFTES
jgi:hypothetical protein